MNVFSFTQKGLDSKVNNDAILFSSEETISNPCIISEQNNYSHFKDGLDCSLIALLADGLGSTFASKFAVEIYNEGFMDLLDLVGEQDIVHWIMHYFVKLEINAARESSGDMNKATSGASIAGVIIHKSAGSFIFNAGDVKVFVVKGSKAYQITRDHFYGNVLENCACAGGGHYISIEGARRDKKTSYFMATNSFCEIISQKYSSIVDGIYDIMNEKTSEETIKKMKYIFKNCRDNVSAIGIRCDN